MSFQLETERLRLRDVREEDIPTLLELFAEPESLRNILAGQADKKYNQQALENAIAWSKFPKREHYKLSVIRKADQTLLGNCTISGVRPKSIETVIGWHYGHQYRNHGYATEAARELLYLGFTLGNVTEIYADCFADNRASIRVMEKIGMKSPLNLGLFNLLRGWSYGESRPAVRYKISRDQWLAQRKRG